MWQNKIRSNKTAKVPYAYTPSEDDLLVLIAQYEGGLTRKQAEDLAAKAQGFQDADHYWQWLAEYVLGRSAEQT